MKAVILAGGLGTRLAEETETRPKPMVEIGGYPILWHIMKSYSSFGINDFVICLGYKGYLIKEYFNNYFIHNSDITFDFANDKTTIHNNYCEPWKVTLVDTGQNTLTGGRLKRVRKYIGDDTFCFTYGDGVSDVNIKNLIEFHEKQKSKKAIVTMTAVIPPARYGALEIEDDKVISFKEKPHTEVGWINGGYFVLEPEVFDYIKGDMVSWEAEPLEVLASENKVSAFKHSGFWLPMDTLRDKLRLQNLWEKGEAPWKRWE